MNHYLILEKADPEDFVIPSRAYIYCSARTISVRWIPYESKYRPKFFSFQKVLTTASAEVKLLYSY